MITTLETTTYVHHGNEVHVRKDLKGKHRDHCLCEQCDRFAPNTGYNCYIAEMTLDHCKKFGLVTPVWECPRFKPAK